MKKRKAFAVMSAMLLATMMTACGNGSGTSDTISETDSEWYDVTRMTNKKHGGHFYE